MKTDTPAEIRSYLAAVDRGAAALPAESRRELLDDLGEHIEVSLSERPGELGAILAELGDPAVIAATALREHGLPPDAGRRRASYPRRVVALFAVGSVLGSLGHLPGAGSAQDAALVVMVAGLVTLWLCRWWAAGQKWLALAAFVLPGMVMSALSDTGGAGEVAYVLVTDAVRAAALVWLWRSRTVPAGPDRARVPRWVGVVLLCALAVCVVAVVLGFATYLGVSGNVKSVDLP